MKFITIGNTHYNLSAISCFWWVDGYVFLNCIGDSPDGIGHHSDPDRAYYKALCRATGVIPCEEVKE